MKRILVLFLLLGLLLIAGCGGQPIQPTTEASQPLGTEDSTVTEPGTSVLTVDAVREQLQQQEAYIQGIQIGLRAVKRISIYNRGGDV